ncbi:unnamed protein product [Victoria cruziana]
MENKLDQQPIPLVQHQPHESLLGKGVQQQRCRALDLGLLQKILRVSIWCWTSAWSAKRMGIAAANRWLEEPKVVVISPISFVGIHPWFMQLRA